MSRASPSGGSHDLSTALKVVALLAVIFAVGALLVGPAPVAVSVTAGGAIAWANLWAMGRLGRALFGGSANSQFWAILAAAKFCLLVVGCYLLVKSDLVRVVPLALGYGALPVGIVVAQLGGRPDPNGADGGEHA